MTNSEDRAQRAPLSPSSPRRSIHRKARRAAGNITNSEDRAQRAPHVRAPTENAGTQKARKRSLPHMNARLPPRNSHGVLQISRERNRSLRPACPKFNSRFPQLCVVLRIFNRQNPRYHRPFSHDDKNDTIGRHLGSTDKSLPAVVGLPAKAGGADSASEYASPRL
jgi:hypothetical protein